MKKILFGITGLTLGGAERVLVDIVNNLCDKYDITIFTIYSGGEFEKELNPKVKRKTLYNKPYNSFNSIQKKIIPLKILLFQQFIYNKKIKENYDVEIAFLEGPITRLFSTKNKATRKIAWVHNDISKVFGNGIKAKLKKYRDFKIYNCYENLVFVSKDNLNKFKQIYNTKAKTQVIYNYIDSKKVLETLEKFVAISNSPEE